MKWRVEKIQEINKCGGWDFLEKLAHNSNKQGEINKRGGWNFSKSVSATSRLLER